MPSRSSAALAAALVALALAGCGGGRSHTSMSGSATAPARPRAGVEASGWPTYHGDDARTGAAPSGPAPQHARRLWAAPVDGDVYAEPLVAGGSVWDAAIDGDRLYALDARSGRNAFSAAIGTPAHFIAPTVAGGRVYVAASGRLLAFGSG